jgi:hypothetical protein
MENRRPMPRVWITDGSLPVFSDTERLSTAHRGFLGLPVRYEGFVDPEVALGSSEIAGERPDDALFAEAEWCVILEDPLTEPADSTPVVLQGLIEGKWMNRLLGTKAWRPASIANNVLASGPGIATTVGALASAAGETRLSYELADGRTQEHVTTSADLHGQNVPDLVREVVRLHAGLGERLGGIDLGANGERSAVVNEKARIKAAVRSPNVLNLLPHRAKERLVRNALAEGISVPPGTPVTLTTTDGAGRVVGEASLVWRRA